MSAGIVGKFCAPHAAELCASGLGRSERRLGAARNHIRFKLCNACHLPQEKPAGWSLDFRQVAEQNIDSGFKQLG
jgi:hypothetical protein